MPGRPVRKCDIVVFNFNGAWVPALVVKVLPITEEQKRKGVIEPDVALSALFTGFHLPGESHPRVQYGTGSGQYLRREEDPELQQPEPQKAAKLDR